MKTLSRPRRTAITLVEVIVAALAILLMLCLLLPAMLKARSRTRRNLCEQKLGRLAMATHEYESMSGSFPSGVMNPDGPISSEPFGMHHSWIAQLLPFLDQQQLFSSIDPAVSVYDDRHKQASETMIGAMLCPSSSANTAESDYAACHNDVEAPIDSDNQGIFFLNSEITQKDVLDGLSHTLLLGEKRTGTEQGLGWISGTRATLRNTGTLPNRSDTNNDSLHVGGFGSWHAGIAYAALGDARVTAISDSIDAIAYTQMGGRQDGYLKFQMQPNGDTTDPAIPVLPNMAPNGN